MFGHDMAKECPVLKQETCSEKRERKLKGKYRKCHLIVQEGNAQRVKEVK